MAQAVEQFSGCECCSGGGSGGSGGGTVGNVPCCAGVELPRRLTITITQVNSDPTCLPATIHLDYNDSLGYWTTGTIVTSCGNVAAADLICNAGNNVFYLFVSSNDPYPDPNCCWGYWSAQLNQLWPTSDITPWTCSPFYATRTVTAGAASLTGVISE